MKNKIKVGLASFGMSGLVFHAPLLNSHEGFEITAILERSKELSRHLYSSSKLVRSFEELLADKEIELLIINTPDFLHFEQAKMALNAGKHVVVEKPFTQNYEQAMDLCELAKRKNLVLSVFQNRRWDGDFLTVKKIIADKMLGRLVSFESHFDRYRNFIQPNTWKEELESGSGIVFNLGSHMIDQALLLFGRPKAVGAEIRTIRNDGQNDDFFIIRLDYSENISVSLRGSLLVSEAGPRYILHGTNGSFLKWGTDPQEQDLKDGKLPSQPGWGKEHEENWGLLKTEFGKEKFRGEIETIPGNYCSFYDGLYDAIRHNAQVPVNPEDAALVIRIINMAFESNRTGSLLPV